jgi:hypothetical protein
MVALVNLTIAFSGESGRVKGGRSPAKRTLDATRFTPTLQGSGQAWLCSPGPRARPAARTAPPLGAGIGVGGVGLTLPCGQVGWGDPTQVRCRDDGSD